MWSIAGCVALVAALAAAAPFTPVMPVRGVTVEGNRVLAADHVEALTGIAPDTPMGRVDVSGAAHRVASDPWVKTVTVSRSWPSTIDVTLEEHVAVAFITEADGAHLINREGKDFLVAEPPADAIEIIGTAPDNEVSLARAVEIASSISDRSRGEIAALEAGKYDYVLRTVDGRTVHWGASEDNANKALALETVLQMEGSEFNIANPQLVTSR
ncbi:FtsQ-type POTRA domain-containing protein [Corynebacterium sp. CNCTC7651]|nr:FtsQ-type POTRA domain-containing protein [Corynebacterium sp. CNCTC7651]